MIYRPGEYYYYKYEHNVFIKIYKVLVTSSTFENFNQEEEFNVAGLKILDVIVYYHKRDLPIDQLLLFKKYDKLYDTLEETMETLMFLNDEKEIIKTVLK